MQPSKEMYQIAVRECQKAYKKNIDLGTTEFTLTTHALNGFPTQFLNLPGSDEFLDWVKNFDPRTINGFKKAAHDAMRDILDSKEWISGRKYNLPLVINGHSKEGATAVVFAYYHSLVNDLYCIAFAPAPCLRRQKNGLLIYNNLTIFRDPDDAVHEAGIIRFGQPEVPKERDIWLPDNHLGKYILDHDLSNFKKFIDNMED